MSKITIYVEGQNAIAFAERLLAIEGIYGRWYTVDERIAKTERIEKGINLTASILTITIAAYQGSSHIAGQIQKIYRDYQSGLEKVVIQDGDEFLRLKDITSLKSIDAILSLIPSILSLQEIVKLTIPERHKLLSPFVIATAKDFINEPELTEFSVLDGENWEEDDN